MKTLDTWISDIIDRNWATAGALNGVMWVELLPLCPSAG